MTRSEQERFADIFQAIQRCLDYEPHIRSDEFGSMAYDAVLREVADRLGITDRGSLREGMKADVLLFDPATITDHATFEEPHQLATGVSHVWVNGTLVVEDGNHTGATPGRFVKGQGAR